MFCIALFSGGVVSYFDACLDIAITGLMFWFWFVLFTCGRFV